MVAGCREAPRWGVDTKQPTQNSDHGPLEGELERTVRVVGKPGSRTNLAYGAGKAPLFVIKTECLFSQNLIRPNVLPLRFVRL